MVRGGLVVQLSSGTALGSLGSSPTCWSRPELPGRATLAAAKLRTPELTAQTAIHGRVAQWYCVSLTTTNRSGISLKR
jgi:hypothetical protein